MPSIRSWGTHCPVLATVPDMAMALKLKEAFGANVWLDIRDVDRDFDALLEKIEEKEERIEEMEDELGSKADAIEELEDDLCDLRNRIEDLRCR